MEFTIKEHNLFVEVNYEDSWHNDETHIDYWSLTVSNVDENGDIGDTVFEKTGYADPDFDVYDSDSITDWLSTKGVLGAEAHQNFLQKERARFTTELNNNLQVVATAKIELYSLLATLKDTPADQAITQWLEEKIAGWNPTSTLGKLCRALDNSKRYAMRVDNLHNEIAKCDKALAGYVPAHVKAIADLLAGS